MKKNFLLIVCAVALVLGLSSCGNKKVEESKMIPASAVTFSGENSDLLRVNADSVKVMLVNIGEDQWSVRALIPIANTKGWGWIENTYVSPDDSYHGLDLDVVYIDANGSEIGQDLSLYDDYSKISAVLKAEMEGKTDNILVKGAWENLYCAYESNKATYDKLSGINISGLTLTKQSSLSSSSYSSSSSSSSSSSRSSSDYDYDDEDLDKLYDAAEKSLELSKEAMDLYKSLDD